MAKDYNNRQSSKKGRSSSASPWLIIVLAFLGGYFIANTVDFNRVNQWLESNVLAEHAAPKTPEKKKPEIAQKTNKPKFEFYTLLSKDTHQAAQQKPASTPVVKIATQPSTHSATIATHSPSPANPIAANPIAAIPTQASKPNPPATPVAVNESKPIKAATKASYLVQIAAFKTRQDAERVKASYVLKGYDVYITGFTTGNSSVYRVILGPFPSRQAAENAQTQIAKQEHIQGILRRAEV